MPKFPRSKSAIYKVDILLQAGVLGGKGAGSYCRVNESLDGEFAADCTKQRVHLYNLAR